MNSLAVLFNCKGKLGCGARIELSGFILARKRTACTSELSFHRRFSFLALPPCLPEPTRKVLARRFLGIGGPLSLDLTWINR